MKKKLCALLSVILTMSMLILPVAAVDGSFTPNPSTDYARSFIAACDGQRWFLDEVERLLNAEQKTLNTVTGRDDFANVVSLGLRDKGITGKIPSAIGELTELRYLFLSANDLSGEIPAALFSLSKLENIDLAGNGYSGAIPSGFGTMPALKQLNLKGNAFAGSIPADILSNTSLTLLDVSGNQLSGAAPAELNQMTGLNYLAISGNPWTAGPMPDLSALAGLKGLSAWNCGFTGEIPASLYTMTALQVLDLAENSFGGEISPSIGNLQDLQLLAIGSNQIGGTVPAELGNLPKLTTLDISNNKLRGKLPASVADIDTVYAQNNYMTGEVLKGLENNEHNFCDDATTEQYQLTAGTPVRVSKTGKTNLYTLLKNKLVSGGSTPAKPLLSADCYIAIVSNDPDGKVTLTYDDKGIYVQVSDDIKTADGVTVTIQIKDNDGSNYSKTDLVLTTESGGGFGGGGAPATPESSTVHHKPYVNGYPDGTFGPERSITREEVTAMLTRVMEYELTPPTFPPFPDVPLEKWSVANIAAAKRHGIVEGYGSGNFGPDDPMTRAELATVLVRIARGDEREFTAAAIAFPDVDQDAWYFYYVIDAARYGLITGYPDGTFRPTATVTRSEAVTMINRMLGRDPETAPGLSALTFPFSDVQTSYWAYLQIMEASVEHEH